MIKDINPKYILNNASKYEKGYYLLSYIESLIH